MKTGKNKSSVCPQDVFMLSGGAGTAEADMYACGNDALLVVSSVTRVKLIQGYI